MCITTELMCSLYIIDILCHDLIIYDFIINVQILLFYERDIEPAFDGYKSYKRG